MGSIELVKKVIEYRKQDFGGYTGAVRDAAETLAMYKLLNNRQIAGALNVSHTIVNRYVHATQTCPGHINWDTVDTILDWLKNGDKTDIEELVGMGSRRKPLEWLWENK